MDKSKYNKFPTVNRIIITTLISVTITFALTVVLLLNYLMGKNIERSKDSDINEAYHVTLVLEDNFKYLSQLLNFTQASFEMLDYNSEPGTVRESADRILTTMLDYATEVHCAWLILEPGILSEDKLYINEYIQKNGKIITSNSLNADEISDNPTAAPWYFEPLMTGNTFFNTVELYKYSVGENPVYTATISMPILVKNKIIGVCGIDILYKDILEFIYNIHDRENRVMMLLSQDMTILDAFDDQLINSNLADFQFKDIDNIRKLMKNGEIYSDETISPITKENVFLYLQPISVGIGNNQQTLYLQIDTPLNVLESEAYNITFFVIVAGCICIILIFAIIYLNTNRLAKPIKDLAYYAKKVATGNYRDDIFNINDNTIKFKSEIAILWNAFDEMLQALKENVRNVEYRVEERTLHLRKLNNYIKLLIDHATNIFILFDHNMNLLYCSNSVLNLLGLGNDDYNKIINKSLSNLHTYYPDQEYAKRSAKRFTRILEGEDSIIVDDTIKWPGKGIRSFHITYRRMLDHNNDFDGIVLTLLDVTDVRIEEAESRLHEMLDTIKSACLMWDESGRIIAFNKESADLFAIPRDLSIEDYNSKYFAIQPEFQLDGMKTETIRQNLISDALEKGFVQFTGQLTKTDGTPINVRVTIARINWLSGFRLIVYIHDISELLEKELDAKAAEERIRIMLDATPLCCYFINDKYDFIDCNQEALNLFGLSNKKEFLRYYPYFLSPEKQPDGTLSRIKAAEYIKETFLNGYTFFEWLNQKLNGELIPTEVTLVRVKYGESNIVLGYSRDLREVKAREKLMIESEAREKEAKIQKEAAQAASEAKSAFLANMSHEIRTPMNSIIGFSELIFEENISSKAHEYLDKIMENSKWLLQIINNILDISKIESGNMELEDIPFDLRGLLSTCKNIISPKAIEKNIDLLFYTDSSIGKRMYGDPTRLRQVLLNLLSNAVKFTESGMVSLYAGIEKTMGDKAEIRFEVKDTGIGMTPEQIQVIFEPFMQADVSMTRKYGGTGLGMTITKNILELMDSKLEIESTPGAGSTICFNVIIKMADETGDISKTDNDIGEIDKPIFNGEILVCEDNKMNQQVIAAHLKRVELNVDIVENGLEGINKVKNRIERKEKPYDLIFMDIHMPVMNGMEATQKIKELGSSTPIVAMTANIMTEDRKLYKSCGMNDYLGKPFTSQELWRCLLKYLTPVKISVINNEIEMKDENLLIKKMQINFVRNNQNKYKEINDAINHGNFKLAHRLAHTLKTNAALIGKTMLQNTAAELEIILKEDNPHIDSDKMIRLEVELSVVLKQLEPLLDTTTAEIESENMNSEQIEALFCKLETMLENINPECVNMIDEINKIPGTGELVRQLEDFDFESAARTLAEIRMKKV